MGGESPQPDIERVLLAVVALLAADRDERADQDLVRGSEVVLAEAGFSYQEIARFTGKNQEMVRGRLRRLDRKASEPQDRAKKGSSSRERR
jgi:hypothetical protein